MIEKKKGDKMKVLCKMIGCSNEESRGVAELGKLGTLEIEGRFTFSSIISSTIKKIEFKEELILIETKNTIYTFKKEAKV